MKSKRLVITLALGLGLILALLLALSPVEGLDRELPARAAPALSTVEGYTADLTVCPAGPPACDYATVQAAVDGASPGDVIKVAGGTYTDIHQRAGITQVVYISKTVTIRGGYTTADWDTPDPDANPTTLDAQGLGRVLVITGTIAPIVEGLRITGGDATGLGGWLWGGDGGGGVYIYQAAATISDCVVYSNTASTASHGYGGGLFLDRSNATLKGNTVQGNTATTADRGYGGGLYFYRSDATVEGNTVQGNTASTAFVGAGGGLYLSRSDAALRGNMVISNTASTAPGSGFGHGGGLYLSGGAPTLEDNTVQGNTARTADRGYGGGLYLIGSDATLNGNTIVGNVASVTYMGYGGGMYLFVSGAALNGNTIISNTASLNPLSPLGSGGGLYVLESSGFTLTNNLVADNHAHTEGGGLWFEGTAARPISGHLLHTTIANNGSTRLVLSKAEGLTASHSSGQGVYVDEYTTLAFTNTIIAGHHSVGITVTTGSTATLEATLWYGNGSDTGGEGYISTGTVNVHDDPAFVDPSAWDYHLTAGSAAIDAGVDVGVTTDIDGDSRPIGAGYDIGADEYVAHIYLPIVEKAGLEAPH